MSDQSIRKIVIAGGGSAGWMAAATLANMLGRNCAIELVESDEIGTVGVGEATIPPIKQFISNLGLNEATFMRETQATIKLGIRFDGWNREGEDYFHPFGTFGIPFDNVPLHQYWLREHSAGNAAPLDDYSVAAVMAAHNKFAYPEQQANKVQSTFNYAYHFDAGLWAKFLRGYSEERSVVRTEGRIADVRLSGVAQPQIAGLTLDDGRHVDGDFFIDCTGFASLLLGKALDIGFVSWGHWLPCDRAFAVPCEGVMPRTPYTRSTAHKAGWQWRIPLQHRIGNGHVFSSAHISEDEAASVLLANLDGKPLADPKLLRFATGRRQQFWRGNCLAVGLAAGFMEPLESTSIHLVQSALSRFLALFPDRSDDPLPALEFNRLSIEEWERIRDFLILHYHLNNRDGAMWQHCRDMELPDELAYRLAHFRANGRLVSPGTELFLNASWLAVLVGQGAEPAYWDPLVDKRPQVDAALRLQQLHSAIAAAVDAMPPHDALLDKVRAG